MTWQNLPCAPTLPALFAACPHGWAEIEFTYQRGDPTADPPQDADCSLEVRRLLRRLVITLAAVLAAYACAPLILGPETTADLFVLEARR
jgi:hypothetical protein